MRYLSLILLIAYALIILLVGLVEHLRFKRLIRSARKKNEISTL